MMNHKHPTLQIDSIKSQEEIYGSYAFTDNIYSVLSDIMEFNLSQ